MPLGSRLSSKTLGLSDLRLRETMIGRIWVPFLAPNGALCCGRSGFRPFMATVRMISYLILFHLGIGPKLTCMELRVPSFDVSKRQWEYLMMNLLGSTVYAWAVTTEPKIL